MHNCQLYKRCVTAERIYTAFVHLDTKRYGEGDFAHLGLLGHLIVNGRRCDVSSQRTAYVPVCAAR